jgi:hypothetical protein
VLKIFEFILAHLWDMLLVNQPACSGCQLSHMTLVLDRGKPYIMIDKGLYRLNTWIQVVNAIFHIFCRSLAKPSLINLLGIVVRELVSHKMAVWSLFKHAPACTTWKDSIWLFVIPLSLLYSIVIRGNHNLRLLLHQLSVTCFIIIVIRLAQVRVDPAQIAM